MSSEAPAAYNKDHFPNGLNVNFSGSKDELRQKFAGSSGIFESESRELFAQRHAIVALIASLVEQVQKQGCADPSSSSVKGRVLEVGFGTGCFTEILCQQHLQVLATDLSWVCGNA